MFKVAHSKPCRTSHLSLAIKAKALRVILEEEFGVPFTFYDANTGETLLSPAVTDKRKSVPPLEPEAIVQLAGGPPSLLTDLGDGQLQLTLVLFDAEKPFLVAVGVLCALVGSGSGIAVEQDRLQKWARAVVERLRWRNRIENQRQQHEEQDAQASRAWEIILELDHIIRRLRIPKDSERDRQRILEAARLFLGAQTILWIPEHDEHIVVHGDPLLAVADCRSLAALLLRGAEPGTRKPIVWNAEQAEHWAARFPQIENLLACPPSENMGGGWLVAINKRDRAAAPSNGKAELLSFRRSDAAALMPFAALMELQARGARRYQEMKDLLVALTRSLTSALDAKDPNTFGHSERVARIGVVLGRELGLVGEELSDIYLAGLLHDIGKIGVSDTILLKPGPLTPEEFELIKKHVTIGHAILAGLQPLRNVLPGIRSHHERVDGKGYPDGLAGDNIPLLARILGVADAYDAMSTRRPYRQEFPITRVVEVLRNGAGSQWDVRVVEALLRRLDEIRLIRQHGVGDSLRQAVNGALRADESNRVTPTTLPIIPPIPET